MHVELHETSDYRGFHIAIYGFQCDQIIDGVKVLDCGGSM